MKRKSAISIDRMGPDSRRGAHRLGHCGRQLVKVQSVERREQEKYSEQKAGVADAVDDEGLHSRIRVLEILIPVADEQVGANTHAFPAHEHHGQVIGADEGQHRKKEEIQVREIAVGRPVVGHIPDGVKMNHRSDASDDHRHCGGQPVKAESPFYRHRARIEPVERNGNGLSFSHQLRKEQDRQHEGAARESRGDDSRPPWKRCPENQSIDDASHQRE